MLKAKPFVKWAGGKRSIIDKLKSLAPFRNAISRKTNFFVLEYLVK